MIARLEHYYPRIDPWRLTLRQAAGLVRRSQGIVEDEFGRTTMRDVVDRAVQGRED